MLGALLLGGVLAGDAAVHQAVGRGAGAQTTRAVDAAHCFAEHDDPETGEHWIDTDAHAMRAPSIAEDEPVQAEAPSCARALPRKG